MKGDRNPAPKTARTIRSFDCEECAVDWLLVEQTGHTKWCSRGEKG